MRRSVGFVGISMTIAFVSSSTASAHPPSSGSTTVVRTPRRGISDARSDCVAPYSRDEATTWSPTSVSAMSVIAIAPMPLPSATAASVPSSAAIFRPTWIWLGLLP
jgi:hypothetical protein